MQDTLPQFFQLGPSARSLTESVETIHSVISTRYPGIDRVALAIYDSASDTLKTFVSSNHDGHTLQAYEAKLKNVPSLQALAHAHQSRVVQDMPGQYPANAEHSQWLKNMGYLSSYTVPIYQSDELAGFIFFDSKSPCFFSHDAAHFLDTFIALIAQLYFLQLTAVRSLIGSVHIASGLARVRDSETGQHLERMAAYSRIIAKGLVKAKSLPDEFVEYVYLFAPLHDIGKVGVPDRILFKQGSLDAAEWDIMRQHVEIGSRLIEQMITGLGMTENLPSQIMRNIVAGHHERGDGSGYPQGLKMETIALEARIIAVADVYDALSTTRPYKPAWPEDKVWAELKREVALGRLDGDCVAALYAAEQERRMIQDRHAED
jgi:HD-GYP domain-containing protein (c-di-GMP phosphodiesterase class II)